MKKLLSVTISALCLVVMLPQAQAKTVKAPKPQQASKERLVLMPLRVGEDIQNMLGAMETALAQGLQQKYEVFSGMEVEKKTREIFRKESAKKNCDETRCMEDIAIAFQSELIAVANVTKIEGGYLLALSIKNVFDNKSVYNNSVPCKSCDAFQVVDKLKELSSIAVAPVPSSSVANVQEDIVGAHSVGFQPIQNGGELQGCSLVYTAVQYDRAYLDGRPIVIIGNITLKQIGANLFLALKIGVKNLVGNNTIERPNFAYLQTTSHSTAKVEQQAMDGEEGFRLYGYSLFDSSVMGLYGEILDSGKVTIAFNRNKGGMDVLVPIDFEVIDSAYQGGDKVVRRRSKETMNNFVNCASTLTNQVQDSLGKSPK